MTATTFTLAVEECLKTLVECGVGLSMTAEHKRQCTIRMERLFLQLACVGVTKEMFTKASIAAGRHIGKTKALLDWIIQEGGDVPHWERPH